MSSELGSPAYFQKLRADLAAHQAEREVEETAAAERRNRTAVVFETATSFFPHENVRTTDPVPWDKEAGSKVRLSRVTFNPLVSEGRTEEQISAYVMPEGWPVAAPTILFTARARIDHRTGYSYDHRLVDSSGVTVDDSQKLSRAEEVLVRFGNQV